MDFVTETWLHAAACGAGAALVLAAAAARAGRRERLERGLCLALAALGVASFANFGDLHHQADRGFVHRWEHFHYHLGSKYFPELGYDGLYVASIAAQHASHPQLRVGRRLRDLRTNRSERAGDASAHRREVRARFSTERWEAFVADHAVFARRFGCRRILHADDASAGTRDVETLLRGRDPIRLDVDLVAIPVPGHTRGSTALLYRDEFLFTGDHLWWDADEGGLHASRSVCWWSWSEQKQSLRRLLERSFRAVLPGHGGRRIAASPEAMRAELRALIDRLG